MFVLVSAGGFAQNTKSISGTVREKGSNETVIGATVQVKGTHNGVITNENGEYTIKNVFRQSTCFLNDWYEYG